VAQTPQALSALEKMVGKFKHPGQGESFAIRPAFFNDEKERT